MESVHLGTDVAGRIFEPELIITNLVLLPEHDDVSALFVVVSCDIQHFAVHSTLNPEIPGRSVKRNGRFLFTQLFIVKANF